MPPSRRCYRSVVATTNEDQAAVVEKLNAARAQLGAGDPRTAFQTIRGALQHPAPALEDLRLFVDAIATFRDIARAIAGEELGSVVESVVKSPDDPGALYDAAYALYEQQLFGIAATLLVRANRLAPGQAKIVTELATTLEETMSYGEASLVLAASGLVGTHPFVTYLAGFHGIMSGDIEEARKAVTTMAGSTGDLAIMRDALEGMAVRAETLRAAKIDLGEHGLSAWHAAISGSILLHESPHGFDTPMRGRYAYVADSAGLMRLGIARVAALLRAEDLFPSRVVAAPDRASQILALATSRVLDVPCVPWSVSEGEGLFVAWDMDKTSDEGFLIALRAQGPRRILWSHASAWVDPFPYSPDLTTLLHQQITHPFLGGALVRDPATGKVEPAPPDPRPIQALAEEIVTSAEDPSQSQTPGELPLAIAKALRDLPPIHALGLHRTSADRMRNRKGSPVKSAYFA